MSVAGEKASLRSQLSRREDRETGRIPGAELGRRREVLCGERSQKKKACLTHVHDVKYVTMPGGI